MQRPAGGVDAGCEGGGVGGWEGGEEVVGAGASVAGESGWEEHFAILVEGWWCCEWVCLLLRWVLVADLARFAPESTTGAMWEAESSKARRLNRNVAAILNRWFCGLCDGVVVVVLVVRMGLGAVKGLRLECVGAKNKWGVGAV